MSQKKHIVLFTKKYIISKRLVWKNWYKILICNFVKKILGLLQNLIMYIILVIFDNNRKNIDRINNKLCAYDYNDEYIKILNEYGEIIEKTQN